MNQAAPNCYAITFDVDWAADWMIQECVAACRDGGIPATFFATHESDILADLVADPVFEVGIHPNFLPGSTQGDSPESVLRNCLQFVPQARSMRSHGLYQSSSLLHLIADEFEQIETDVSLFLPFHDDLRATDLYFGRNKRRLTRIPFMWEDDIAAFWPGWRWDSSPQNGPGLRVFNFHPVHVALNTATLAAYEALKETHSGEPLYMLGHDACARFINAGAGVADFLKRLINSVPVDSFFTIADINAIHRRHNP